LSLFKKLENYDGERRIMLQRFDDKDFEKIFESHSPLVRRFLFKLSRNIDLSEDLTQETFLTAYKFKDHFDSEKGTIEKWLYTISKRTYFTYLRKKSNSEQIRELKDFILQDKHSPEKIFSENFIKKEIMLALNLLSEPEKSIVYLKYIEDKSIPEAAKFLELNERTVRRRHLKGLQYLRKILTEKGIHP
jgi:RNA polymerase sigma-70 factor (ECF subfamily)